jgi:exodeoxyribonuclease VII small subunit
MVLKFDCRREIMPKRIEKSSRSFEDDMKRLEEIVGKLESGVQIEEALLLYEEGMKLSGKLELKLSDIEKKVYEVRNVSRLDNGQDTEPDIGLFK